MRHMPACAVMIAGLLARLVASPPTAGAVSVTTEAVRNARIACPGNGGVNVTLRDGLGRAGAGSGASEFRVDRVAFDDVTGDGKADAVLTLVEEGRGSASGTWCHLVVLSGTDPLRCLASLELRADADFHEAYAEGIEIAAGVIRLRELVHGPDDPHCCPTVRRIEVLRLVGDRLVSTTTGDKQDRQEANADIRGFYTDTGCELVTPQEADTQVDAAARLDGPCEVSHEYRGFVVTCQGWPPLRQVGYWYDHDECVQDQRKSGYLDKYVDEARVKRKGFYQFGSCDLVSPQGVDGARLVDDMKSGPCAFTHTAKGVLLRCRWYPGGGAMGFFYDHATCVEASKHTKSEPPKPK